MLLEQYCIYEFDISEEKDHKKPKIEYLIILSPLEMNEALKTVIVAPLCNQCAITPTTFLIDDITRVQLDQMFSIKKDKAVRFIDKINSHKIKKIKKVLDDMLIK